MKSMKKTNTILLLLLLFLVNFCKDSSTEADDKVFINTLWKLESFETDGNIIVPPKDQIYNIKFKEDNGLNGISDCNEFSSNYILKSSYLTIGAIITTEMYCGDTSLGGMYVDALQRSKSYKIDKNKLLIYYGTNSKLTFIGG